MTDASGWRTACEGSKVCCTAFTLLVNQSLFGDTLETGIGGSILAPVKEGLHRHSELRHDVHTYSLRIAKSDDGDDKLTV